VWSRPKLENSNKQYYRLLEVGNITKYFSMEKLTILTFFLFLNLSLFSQKLTIKSSTDNKPVSYAKLIFKDFNKTEIIAYTDSLGVFYLDNQLKTDSILIESFQFNNKKILYPEINQIIFLTERDNILSDLVINISDNKLLGNDNLKQRHKYITIPYKDTQFVKLFVTDESTIYNKIKSLKFVIDKRNKGDAFFVRMIIYKNIGNKPAELIYKGTPVRLTYSNKGKMSIFPDTDIIIPTEGYFVGIEYLGAIKIKKSKRKYIDPGFKFVYNLENQLCYIKTPIKGEWGSFDYVFCTNDFEKKYLCGFYPILFLEVEK